MSLQSQHSHTPPVDDGGDEPHMPPGPASHGASEVRAGRHEAETRAHHSEERFRLLVEGVRDYAIYMLDPEGVITSWNPGVQRIKGYTPEEAVGKHFSIFYTPEDRERGEPKRSLRTAVEEGRFEYEGWRVRKDGTRFWANVVVTPLYEDGQLRGFAKVTRDLTERRRVEEELRQSEELFRQTFDHAPIGMSMVGLDYKFLRANTTFCDMLGYTREELAALTFVDITYPEDIDADLALAEKLFSGEIPTYKLEKRYITKAGEIIWIELTVTIVRDASERPLYVLGMVEDISERKEAEETIKRLNEDLERRVTERTAELQAANAALEIEIAEREAVTQENVRLLAQVEEQRRRLDNIIANVPGVVWEAWGLPDAEGQRIDFVSHYVETLLGYTQDEWLQTPNFWLTIVHPDDREQAARVARQTFESGRAGTNQFRWVTKDGRVVWVEAHSATMHDEQGNPLGMRGVTMDITERKRLEEQVLDQAEFLRREYERLANLVANVKVGLALSDKENRYLLVNDAWLHLTGYTREQVLGRRVEEFDTSPNRDMYQEIADRILARGEPVSMQESLLENQANPEGRYIDASIVPMRDDEGNVTGLLTAIIDVTEKVRARREIEAQRSLFRTVLETAPVAITLYDRDMCIMEVNSEQVRMSGATAEQLVGKIVYDLYPAALERKEMHDRVLAGEPIDLHSVYYRHPDGYDRYYDIRYRPMFDSNGQIMGLLSSSIDVTEQVMSRQAIEDQRKFLQLIIESTPVAIAFYDRDMRVVDVNSTWLTLTGLRLEDVKGNILYDVNPQANERRHLYERALAGEMYQGEGILNIGPQGEQRYVDAAIRPVHDSEGKIMGLLVTSVDVTEKIRSKNEIEAQRSLLATIIEGMPVGVVYYDTDMRIVNYNAEWERIAGVRNSGDLRGHTLYEIDPATEDRRELHKRALQGEMISLVDVPHVQPRTGKTVYGDIHLRPVRDADGNIVGLLSAIVDSTLRHELDQAKDSFIALASHELKTPITTIKGYAQSTLRNIDVYDGARLARTLTIINEQANRITRLVNEMLDVSRMESQTLTFDLEHFDLRTVVEEVASNQALVSPEFELDLQLPDQPLMVGADRQRIEQVLTNLVQNAIKYSGDKKHIEVAAWQEGGEVIGSVRDYGVGIPATQQSRVFQRFFRASNVSTSNYSGLGLGLFISHGIITRHGGRVWLESAEGEGSTFYFALPMLLE
ncbi:MAG: PAS domain S-box protein [Chloroflexota bacterium]|nr:PAS domain S-box protein [Chloroflexota bacterium]